MRLWFHYFGVPLCLIRCRGKPKCVAARLRGQRRILNTFITPTWVTKDVATNFKNSMKFLGQFDRSWDDSFKDKPEGAQIGYTVQARIQQRFTVSEGQALQQQAILNQTVPITINHQYHVDMGWSSAQATLEVEEVQSRYTKPAGEALASKWDSQAGAEVFKSVYFSQGTPGTTVTQNQVWTDSVAQLMDFAVPEDFCGVISPTQRSSLLNANFALFQPKNDYFKTGQFADEALGVNEWYTDSLLPVFTTGTFTASTPIVTAAGLTGTTLTTSGWGTYALKAGDIFTVDGVYGVNPVSYTSTGRLQQFVLSSDVAGTSTGTLTFQPSIITSGQLQTVTASPAASAAITFVGSTGSVSATMAATVTKQNFVFHRSAFAFVMADLKENLAGAITKRVQSKVAGLSMRYAEQYNIQTDQNPSRIDTIAGVAVILPYFALRVQGAAS